MSKYWNLSKYEEVLLSLVLIVLPAITIHEKNIKITVDLEESVRFFNILLLSDDYVNTVKCELSHK